MRFRIDDAVLEQYPDVAIGVVLARGIDNRLGNEPAAGFLFERVKATRSAWTADRLASDPRILAWREAYRAFGAKPKKHRSSVENLIRTVLDRGEIPSINPVVDVYNTISLKHVVPVGGDDLDRVAGDIRLTIAAGTERFVPLNATDAVSPKPGEVVYRDDEDVLCRRWNWRECDKSKMTEASTDIALVVEGLPPISRGDIARITAELAETIERTVGPIDGATVHLLDRDTPSIDL